MNNINNDINKFDGKYLKCIVSKYKAVTNYLANSGSMIILQPGIDSINRNYMYLGDEFIASGYGFSTEEVQRTGERIVKKYDLDIAELKKADSIEKNERTKEIADINNRLSDYVKINDGPIENTVFRIDGKTIKTKDIILYGEEANYNDLKIVDVKIYVYGEYINNEIDKSLYYKDNILLCPLGSRISKINIDITTQDNDSGGIDKIIILHNKILSSYSNINNDSDVEGVMIKYDYDYDYNLKDENNLEYYNHKWYYTKTLNNGFIIDKYLNNAVKNVFIYVKETPEALYKYYPGLERKGYKILSRKGIIHNHKIDLNMSLDIMPQYYFRWSVNNDFNTINCFNTTINCASLNHFKDYDTTNITIDINYEDTSLNHIYKVYIAIPDKFVLHKIYLVDNNLQKYNWTGAVKIKYGVNMPCAYVNENNDNTWPCCTYNIYCLDGYLNNFKDNINKLNLEIIYNKINNYENTTLCVNKSNADIRNDLESYSNTGWSDDILNDEEFNNLYWISNNHQLSKLDIITGNGLN